MTRRQCHCVDKRYVPCRHDQSPRIRIFLDLLDDACDLVIRLPVRPLPTPPLRTVDRTQIAILIRPLVPDRDAVVLQILNVRLALQEPEKLVNDGLCMHLLRREQRKAGSKIETHLIPEHGERSRSRPVIFLRAVILHVPEEIQVLFHAQMVQEKAFTVTELRHTSVMFSDRFTVRKEPLKSRGLFLRVIAGTAIWAMILPTVLLHASLWLYQEIYFSVYGIPKMRLQEFIIMDRHKLPKLRLGQKLSCAFCAYTNGVAAWFKAISNRTEVYSCAIKHSVVKEGQEYQKDFFEYDDFR